MILIIQKIYNILNNNYKFNFNLVTQNLKFKNIIVMEWEDILVPKRFTSFKKNQKKYLLLDDIN